MTDVRGRRRADTASGLLPADLEVGDYWKVLDPETGEPAVITEYPSNLTRTWWRVVCPMPGDGFALANLMAHTVREHEDGTISVLPGDGSSNSILVTGGRGGQWHGYIDHGRLHE